MYYYMLTLDLEKYVQDENRNKFNKYLEDLGWIKNKDITTLWTKVTAVLMSDSLIKDNIKDAASAASVKVIKAAYIFSANSITYYNIP